MEFKPWKTFRKNYKPEKIKVEEPPCKCCVHWNPVRKYKNTDYGMIYDGVILCHAKEMFVDFSCFADNNKGKKSIGDVITL